MYSAWVQAGAGAIRLQIPSIQDQVRRIARLAYGSVSVTVTK